MLYLSTPNDYFDHLLEEYEKCLLEGNHKITVLGDLNSNLANLTLLSTKMLTHFMKQLQLQELVNQPTRITGNTSSHLDVILTNSPDYHHYCSL